VSQTDIKYGMFCLCCDGAVRLEDTGETFGSDLMQKYRCPECSSTFQVNQMYKIEERDNTNKSTETDTT